MPACPPFHPPPARPSTRPALPALPPAPPARPSSACLPAWSQGEVDVILDLVGSVEQQQFVGVAHLPRKPSSLEDLARDRALRLAHRRHQLKVCSLLGGRLVGSLLWS